MDFLGVSRGGIEVEDLYRVAVDVVAFQLLNAIRVVIQETKGSEQARRVYALGVRLRYMLFLLFFILLLQFFRRPGTVLV